MDSLYLPYLSKNDTLQAALKRMKQTDGRAIVVDHYDGEHRLYMNRAVVDAVKEEKALCEDLPRETGMLLGDFYTPLDVKKLDQIYLYNFFERILDEQGVSYGLPFAPPAKADAVALVITRHEGLAHNIQTAVKVCLCPDGHDYECPPIAEDSNCRVDGKPLECY